ncbi:MAG TPA: hypothetical protein VJH34_01965 [archaeon]|nr:hypothetical protein [archaeon]
MKKHSKKNLKLIGMFDQEADNTEIGRKINMLFIFASVLGTMTFITGIHLILNVHAIIYKIFGVVEITTSILLFSLSRNIMIYLKNWIKAYKKLRVLLK